MPTIFYYQFGVFMYLRSNAIEIARQSRLCGDEIDFGKRVYQTMQAFNLSAQVICQREKNLRDFSFFKFVQSDQIIIGIDGCQWLDEGSLTAGGHPVHNT